MVAHDSTTTAVDCSRYVESIQRGAAWLIQQQHPDGSMDPDLGIGAFYKVPWALAVTGHTVEASRLLNWIRREALGPDGDIAPVRSPIFAHYYPYANSWVAAGAWKLGYYDLATRAIDFILTFQDPATGGFFSEPERTGRQEIWVTCGAAWAAINCGRLAAAQRTADYLARMLKEQPEIERRFYSVYEPGRGLVRDFPADRAVEYVVDVDRLDDQWDFLPGIALAVLGRLYLATADPALLETAAGYAAFARRLSEERFARHRLTKGGWGGAVMYLATGDPHYRQVALNVAEHYASAQRPDGSWLPGVAALTGRVFQIDVTAEIVALMDEMLQALAV